jgi:hypothetical protein
VVRSTTCPKVHNYPEQRQGKVATTVLLVQVQVQVQVPVPVP